MIEIITASGVSLDLDPSAEFEIEIENPMLSDSHIPVAFSTSISFLPTPKNKIAFGYMAAMLQEPAEKKISVVVYANAIPLFYGVLEYEGIEEEVINYNFVGKDLESEWGGYIHQLKHLTKWQYARSNDMIRQMQGMFDVVQKGGYDTNGDGAIDEEESYDYGIPMLLNSESITEIEYTANSLGKTAVTPDVKYHNYYWNPIISPITPAVKVSAILKEALKNVSIDESFIYEGLAILGLHRSRQYCQGIGLQTGNTEGTMQLDVADTLPQCTVFELVSNLLKMNCATLFRDGQQFVIKSNKNILYDTNVVVWDEKISGSISYSNELPYLYTFGFSNDEDNTPTIKPEDDSMENAEGCIFEAATMGELLTNTEKAGDYIAIRDNRTGDMFSGKGVSITVQGSHNSIPYIDMLSHKLFKAEADSDSESNIFDMSLSLKCVRCMPVGVVEYTGYYSKEKQYLMCPIVKTNVAEDNRSSDVWIGCLHNNQLIDKGFYFSKGATENSYAYGGCIDPAILYRKYHSPFANWLAQSRRVITADFVLSLKEISALRLYNKISLYNQFFLIKKISLPLSAIGNSPQLICRIELIECPLQDKAEEDNIIRVEYWEDSNNLYNRFRAVAQYPVASDVVVAIQCEDGTTRRVKIFKGQTQSETKRCAKLYIMELPVPFEDHRYIYKYGGVLWNEN